MSDEEKQIGVRVRKSLWQEFRNDVIERKGGIRGHLKTEVENALTSYIDASAGGDNNDRLTRIESELKTIRTQLEERDKNKKGSDVSQTTEKRVEKIAKKIDEENDGSPKVHEKVVELAIRENAGGSDPTLRRYKKLLKQDGHLYDHPINDSRFFTESRDFVMAVNALRKGGKLSGERYSEILNEYGEDWWLAQQEQNQEDQPKGFQ